MRRQRLLADAHSNTAIVVGGGWRDWRAWREFAALLYTVLARWTGAAVAAVAQPTLPPAGTARARPRSPSEVDRASETQYV